ncbi:MAG: MerR family transcriptional regulator, partial [Clostridia bacterium]|nr:MerR family transcriptional regulator [Clostridia bacterium]
MNIWEAAKATGLTKKAIRYYEKMGLLSPTINQDNNYRDYSWEDIDRLKQISVLRRLGVPVAEIKEALRGTGQLAQVLKQHLT